MVEVHKSEGISNLWYNVGKVDVGNKRIDWGSSQKYDKGIMPDIALNDRGTVVEVHKTENDFSNALYYHTGTLDESSKKINFCKSKEYDSGDSPSVALNNSDRVIETHKSQSRDTLWYHTGTVSRDSVSFGKSNRYDDGISTYIALANNGQVVEVHRSEVRKTLWFHQGVLEDTTLLLGPSCSLDDGVNPSVAVCCYSGSMRFVEVHESEGWSTLWSTSSRPS